MDLNDVCKKLVAKTIERGARDNVTVLVAHVANPSLAQPTGIVADTITKIRSFPAD